MKKKKMAINKFKNILLIFSGLIIGYLTAPLLFKFASFSFTKTIVYQVDLGGLLSVGITIFVAFYVTRVLTQKNEEDRVEKDLIIEDVKRIKERLNSDVYQFLDESGKIDGSLVAEKFKTTRISLSSICGFMEKHAFIETNNLTSMELNEKVRDLKDLLTDDINAGVEFITNDGKITYSPTRKQTIQKTLSDFNQLVFELIMIINRKNPN